jgi:hypothetical protein
MPQFQKRHYEVIASVMHDVLSNRRNTQDRFTVIDIVEALAREFKRDNPRFNSDRFGEACVRGEKTHA